ncbi:MAG: hypothetical protein WBI63_07860 [Coriobacteriia bacterium]
MTPETSTVRDAYMRWLRTEGLLLATPLVTVAVAQLALSSASEYPPPPLGLHSMMLAIAVGAVAFGRALKRRPTQGGTGHAPAEAIALVRSTSRMLMLAAITPSLIGLVLVPITRSIVDLYIMLALTLLGLITLFPRYVQWESWYASLTAAVPER